MHVHRVEPSYAWRAVNSNAVSLPALAMPALAITRIAWAALALGCEIIDEVCVAISVPFTPVARECVVGIAVPGVPVVSAWDLLSSCICNTFTNMCLCSPG